MVMAHPALDMDLSALFGGGCRARLGRLGPGDGRQRLGGRAGQGRGLRGGHELGLDGQGDDQGGGLGHGRREGDQRDFQAPPDGINSFWATPSNMT